MVGDRTWSFPTSPEGRRAVPPVAKPGDLPARRARPALGPARNGLIAARVPERCATRCRLRRHPGTVLAEVLDPIPPGLEKREFLKRLQNATEEATARLVAEGERSAHG